MDLTTAAKALAHPTRRAALELIYNRTAGGYDPVSPVDAVLMLDGAISLGTMSHHFRALRDAGLIKIARTEQRRGALKNLYAATPDAGKVLAAARALEAV